MDEDIIFLGTTTSTDTALFPSPHPSACAHRQLPRASDAPHTFGIRHAGRRMHSFVIGATGQGKTPYSGM
jgi:hypothetical protein